MQALMTCVVAGLQYLIHPQKLGTIQETINPDAIIPVTLLTTSEIFDNLEAILRLFDSYDDVFIPEFGTVLVEKTENGTATDWSSLLITGKTRDIYHLSEMDILTADRGFASLPSGPYILHGPNLHQAWRLYDDEFGAFEFGVVPESVDKPDGFQVLNAGSLSGASKAVPVPSRLYHPPPSPKKPLNGLRMSITDPISLNGTLQTFSSRAWSSLYKNAATSTAPYVKKLLDMGVIIVGKTKTAQFATGEEWVDEQMPRNPRGDGYLVAPGASSGAISGLSGYEWLNYAFGIHGFLNTSLAADGLFSLLPSARSVSLGGILTTSRYDQAALFSRDIDSLHQLAAQAADVDEPPKWPKRLVYPVDLFPGDWEGPHPLTDKVVTSLENFLGVKIERLSLEGKWFKQPPAESNGQTMQEYMDKATFLLWARDYFHTFDGFEKEFEESFEKKPFIDATPRSLMAIGKKVSKDDQDSYLQRIKTFQDWFQERIMPISAKEASDTAMVLPCGVPEPLYLDRNPKAFESNKAITSKSLPLLLGVPLLTLPFAQVPYESQVSDRTEYLPVCVSLLGAHGSDLMLIKLAKQAFELAQWRTRVDTGRFAFPPGDNGRNVDDEQYRPVMQDSSLSDEL